MDARRWPVHSGGDFATKRCRTASTVGGARAPDGWRTTATRHSSGGIICPSVATELALGANPRRHAICPRGEGSIRSADIDFCYIQVQGTFVTHGDGVCAEVASCPLRI